MSDRRVWRTQKVRAEDLEAGDVTRDAYGKWATVTSVAVKDRYVTVCWDSLQHANLRTVDLVDVQVVKPS